LLILPNVIPAPANCPFVTVPEDGKAPVAKLEKNDAEFAGSIAVKVGSNTSSVSVAALRTRAQSVLSKMNSLSLIIGPPAANPN